MLFNLTFTRDIADELGANVTRNLVKAVQSGSLGGLAVDPNSLTITQSGGQRNFFIIYLVIFYLFIYLFFWQSIICRCCNQRCK